MLELESFAHDAWHVADEHGWHERNPKVDEIAARYAEETARHVRQTVSALRHTGKTGRWYLDDDRHTPSNSATLASLLMVADEVAEAIQAVQCPAQLQSELADIIIRVCDLAVTLGVNLPEVVKAKHEINKTRPHRHGGKLL